MAEEMNELPEELTPELLRKKEIMDKYLKGETGLITSLYNNQRRSSKKRGHPMPDYSKEELRVRLIPDFVFQTLMNNWGNCGFHKDMKPSLDRLDDNMPYTMNNIQLMTWGENQSKARFDTRIGKLLHGHKPQKAVIQLTKSGEFVKTFPSASEASRQVGISKAHIGDCCREQYEFAGGYRWKFK